MNKNLNDKILVNIKLKSPAAEPMYVNYILKDVNTNNNLYYGRIWFNNAEQEKYVYLNDIFEGLKDSDWYQMDILSNDANDGLFRYAIEYKIDDIDGADYIDDNITGIVDLIHPLRLIRNNEDCLDNNYADIFPMLSGMHNTVSGNDIIVEPGLLPVIPEGYKDQEYKVLLGGQIDITNKNIIQGIFPSSGYPFESENLLNIPDIKAYTQGSVVSIPNDYQKGDIIAIAYSNIDIESPDYDTIVKLALIANGNQRYFLSWFDRCGGILMLPFCKIYTRNSSYDYIEKINEFNEKDKISISTNDSFVLNTDWIPEDKLPYYESMFVSPYICLWDDELKETYKAVITDKEFTYKTFKNQGRRLFNLLINIEISKTENILY